MSLSILKSIGHWFGVGVKEAVKFEKAALPIEQEIAAGIGIANPALGATLEGILEVVGRVEQVATAVSAAPGSGIAKLAVALPDVEALVLADPIFRNKPITDSAKFKAALAQFTSAFVDMTNLVGSTAPDPPTTTAVSAAKAVVPPPAK